MQTIVEPFVLLFLFQLYFIHEMMKILGHVSKTYTYMRIYTEIYGHFTRRMLDVYWLGALACGFCEKKNKDVKGGTFSS